MKKNVIIVVLVMLFLSGCNNKKSALCSDEGGNMTNATILESTVSDNVRFRLVCSDPAAGNMIKKLEIYDKSEGSWKETEDLTMVIPNYPQGFLFVDENTGFIITDYHGERNYVYRTDDGGNNWEGSYVGEKEDIYSNGMGIELGIDGSVVIISNAKTTEDGDPESREYISYDMGKTWIKR